MIRPSLLLLILIGGAAGTALREALTLAYPPRDGLPYVILGINVVGAFLLGWLLDSLARRGADAGSRRTARLLLGTGALGGFTTYSTLATGAAQLAADGRAAVGVGYALLTVVVGATATVAGIALATVLHRRTPKPASRGTQP